MELESYDIPKPGRYVLRVQGMAADRTADSSHRIVFTHPRLARTAAYVVGIVLSAGLLIGSVVLFILALLSKGDAA